jgi:apolipoprotein N-acyltransferase
VLLGANTCLFGWLGRRLWLRGGIVAALGLPALWVAIEWLQTYLWSGFPWNLAGYAWVAVPGALPLSAWIGIYGISFMVLVVNAALARSIVSGRPAPWLAAVGGCWLLLAFGARWAGGPALEEMSGPVHEVRLIQPDIPNQESWDPVENRAGYQRLLRLSEAACDVEGALLIWPESAAWPRHSSDPELRADLERLTRLGCAVIFNSVEREGDLDFNSALLIDREGVAGRYDKRHLVPYGEYVPMAEWLPFVGTVARMAGQFSAGSEPRLLPWAGERLGMSICFEVVFPAEVAELVRAGATLLVTITNDAWYGDTAAPWQHFRAARFRAAELRRPLLRAAITGVSGVIGPDGVVARRLGVFEEGVIRMRIRGGTGLSPAARRPWLVPLACSLAAGFAILTGARGRSRRV